MKTPQPSGTAVLLKEADQHFEVLLLRRSTQLSFHGGAWVFPGGKVDPNDFPSDDNDITGAARNAAARETREEAGLEILPERMILLSRWTTPEGLPRRFTAWFFVTEVADCNVVIDHEEISEFQWIRPDAAVHAQRAGELALPPPTFVTLLALTQYESVDMALSTLLNQRPMVFTPKVCETDTGLCFLYEGDAGYELHDANQPGARHRLSLIEGQYMYERSG